uniref:Uncharacterized protein n=1 Tax=Rhizophora mucronata TaxID=61149 RepID=A0A2P2QNJ5_RHIMU
MNNHKGQNFAPDPMNLRSNVLKTPYTRNLMNLESNISNESEKQCAQNSIYPKPDELRIQYIQ